MLVLPVSNIPSHATPAATSAARADAVGVAEADTTYGATGDIDLLNAMKIYREKSLELSKVYEQEGEYRRETLSDSEIKSLRVAGVPIDAFLRQHGSKLGWREYGALSELIMKTIDKQGPTGHAVGDVAGTQAATGALKAHAYA